MDDDKLPLDAAFIAEMKRSRRKTLSQALAPVQPQDFDWEPARSNIAAHVPDFANMDAELTIPFERMGD